MSSVQTISLGITGGIGSGKSFVCHILQEMGYPVMNTDDEARRLMVEDDTLVRKLSELIGKPILDKEGKLRKTLLSQYIRTSNENAQQVNALVHPAVRRSLREWVTRQTAPLVIIECALLFETNFDKEVDYTLSVSAPIPVRIERVMKRDGKVYDEVCQWMSMQMDDTEKEKRSNFVIMNDGVVDIHEQLNIVLQKIMKNVSNDN